MLCKILIYKYDEVSNKKNLFTELIFKKKFPSGNVETLYERVERLRNLFRGIVL